MISADPVVSSPDPADSSSFLSSPDKMPLIAKEERENSEEQPEEKKEETSEESSLEPAPERAAADPETTGRNGEDNEARDGEDGEENGSTDGGEDKHQTQLQLSVPDLINKEVDSRAKPCDVWLKVSDSRLASTPRSGKTPCRISLGEDVLLGNGAPCSEVSPEESERHPDLLSFE